MSYRSKGNPSKKDSSNDVSFFLTNTAKSEATSSEKSSSKKTNSLDAEAKQKLEVVRGKKDNSLLFTRVEKQEELRVNARKKEKMLKARKDIFSNYFNATSTSLTTDGAATSPKFKSSLGSPSAVSRGRSSRINSKGEGELSPSHGAAQRSEVEDGSEAAAFGEESLADESGRSASAAAKRHRRPSLVRMERSRSRRPTRVDKDHKPSQKSSSSLLWRIIVRMGTLLIPDFVLRRTLGSKDPRVLYTWREKVTLCWIIFWLCLCLAFMTYGLSLFVCDNSGKVYKYAVFERANKKRIDRWFLAHGKIYSPFHEKTRIEAKGSEFEDFVGEDATFNFPSDFYCRKLDIKYPFKCPSPGCFEMSELKSIYSMGEIAFEWGDIEKKSGGVPTKFVMNGKVYDASLYVKEYIKGNKRSPFGSEIDKIVALSLGKDSTKAFSKIDTKVRLCLEEMMYVGRLDVKTMGCIVTDIILWLSLIVILSVVFIRFFLASYYSWFVAYRLGRKRKGKKSDQKNILESKMSPNGSFNNGNQKPEKFKISKYANAKSYINKTALINGNYDSAAGNTYNSYNSYNSANPYVSSAGASVQSEVVTVVKDSIYPEEDEMQVIMLVTCYSEGEDSIRKTLDSLAATDYPDSSKLLFIISDGIIKGAGNALNTPDIIISMLELTSAPNPSAYHTVALAEGSKRLNAGKVYTGYYHSINGQHRVPTILIVKCGTTSEAAVPNQKPGNRGKRDSQIILMSFLSKALFDDRLTPLEYDMHRKVRSLTGNFPSAYEAVLMVDADTYVLPDSLRKMVNVLHCDQLIMGMCGETQIANKCASWVTAIQVFEYYISHHLSKAFESIFGGVTCLPGCFCMYRIKARRGVEWVPLLANPDIIDSYSENITDTLHKKNLLLLGEDRYLTTLMLKKFPCRKLIFLPTARCRTFVPDKFFVLLSQRRRWINSTIHNLLELVLVRDLCGTFCFSMQFVVFMELIGSLVLPAAIIFTGVLIVSSFLTEPQWIPLFLLVAILGLPAVLILFTTREITYVGWMIIYLLSLPIWNLIFPIYAFWNFDDFSWGQTRQLESRDEQGNKIKVSKKNGHTGDGMFDWTQVSMRKWQEYEKDPSLVNDFDDALPSMQFPSSKSEKFAL